MQSISIFSKIIRFCVAFVVAVCLSCFESHADDCVLGTDGCAPEFTVTTTELSAGTTFSFKISAAGTYYIDWGDGGAIEPIVKGTVGEQTITHTYTNADQYTIGMSGQATLYSTGNTPAAISFMNNTNISGISGSLGAIFGTLTDRVNSDGTLMSDAQPRFYNTFYGCSNLSGLIPENLFVGISGAPTGYMFYSTFYGCSGLSGNIPENLFAGITGAPASYMFCQTFYDCGGLSGSISENLFAGISGAPADNMFMNTFAYCRGLSGSIPENLFAGISGAPASYMFSGTFSNCSGLSGSIPENLFAGISGTPASYMFRTTFAYCRGLSGYVPANLFAGIDKTTTASDQMYYVFYNTGLATSCPASTYQYLTGFESYFSNRVACSACPADYPNSDAGATSENECYRKCTTDDVAGAHSVTGNNYYGTGVDTCQEVVYYISAGEYLPAGGEEPADCPSGYYCPGVGDVRWDEKNDQGLVLCPTDFPNSDSGAKSENDCYKPCTTDDVVNSVSVTGKNYYGDGYDSCAATQCLADWKLQDLYGIVGDTEGLNSAYISTNSSSYGEFRDSAGLDQDYYGISEPGSFAVDYGDTGIITGRGRCSTKPGVGGANPTRFKELDDESGVDGARFCYCQVDSYTPVGGLTQVLYDMLWAFKEESWSESGCNEYCAQSCAGGLRAAYTESLAFRSAVFGYASCNEEVYRVNPGDYLPEGEESPSKCPPGSYCPGAEDISSRPSKAQGANECPSEYPYSDAGAKSESQCYRDCTGDDVANAMTVVGRNYYGDGVDTCIATECVSGWHLKSGINLEELVGSTYEGSNSSYMAGTNSAYINNAGDFVEYGQYEEYGQEYYGISENNSFAVIYDDDKGMITGRARCSEMSDEKLDEITDEFGAEGVENCYCRVDAYVGVDGIKQNISAPWLYLEWLGWDGPETCTDYCVEYCASNMREHMTLDFRGKMFEAAYELPVCSVNQININWNLGYGDNNVSTTTCSYTDVIEYPTDPVRPGYTFTGWKLVE